MWVEESSDLLDEFLTLEETNGCIPEQGISLENKEAIKKHKQQVYLQYPNPILTNTWTSAILPMQTRKRPPFRPPKELLQAIVHQLFQETDNTKAYYQGEVIQVNPSKCIVLWTDGHRSHHSPQDVRSMLYDPISYVYDFLSQ